MKLTITHLKAPWPLGAVVGDVVELPAVPAWAAGKCTPAADDAEVTAVFAPAAEPKPALVTNIEPADGQGVVTGDASGEASPEIAPAAESKAGKKK